MSSAQNKQAYEFVMGFIESSDRYRKQPMDRHQEVLRNFMVELDSEGGNSASSPYDTGYNRGTGRRHRVMLKDPETHKAIMTYASKLVRILFGERNREYIKAKPRGWEDATEKAPTVSRLLRYAFALPGSFRTMVEAIIDMLLFGTSIIEVGWHYEEREMPVRSVSTDLGVELSSYTRMRIPVYDDAKITNVDITDFYPDPSRYRIEDMSGAAKKFKMNAIQANAEVTKGKYSAAGVKQAIADIGKQTSIEDKDSFRKGLDQPAEAVAYSDFRDMIGYEYWGDVPWEDDQGSSRRVITVLNNVVVQNQPWPLADEDLPWKTLIINPMVGRFYGLAPGEVIRHDQSFADAMKVLLAEAAIRQVHPPIAYDPDADIDLAKVKAWTADSLIAARGGKNAVGTLSYDARIDTGFAMLSGLKNSMQEASGALGSLGGEEGPSRESATVGASRMQMAMDRPELAALVIENECLPPIGRAILRRYQQFLADTNDLKMRIGELPEPAWIGTIMGDYDVEFVGSRMGMNRQEKLQSWDRLIGLATAIPPLMMQIPWDKVGSELIGDLLELPEIAALMANPQTMMLNALLSQAGQGGAGQNGVASKSEPAGMLPAQAGGNKT